MTTSPLPSAARSQPVTLDVDIELTELTPPTGLPAHSPVNPPEVDLLALQQREEDAFARIFRRKGAARPRPAPAPAVTAEPPRPEITPPDEALPAPHVLDEVVEPAPVLPPILSAPAAAAVEPALPDVELESADLDAFVNALLASAERDQAIPVEIVPLLDALEDDVSPPVATTAPALPAVDDEEPLDFAFDELLIAELNTDADATDADASAEPVPPTPAQPPERAASADNMLKLALDALDGGDGDMATPSEPAAIPDTAEAPALATLADDEALAQAFDDMLAASAADPAPVLDTVAADADAMLEFDLDELLMFDEPAALTEAAIGQAVPEPIAPAPVLEPIADSDTLAQEAFDEPLTLPPVVDAPLAEPVASAVETVTPLAFDLDDMLMLDEPVAQAEASSTVAEPIPATAQHPALAEADDAALELALDELLTAAPAAGLPVLDAPLTHAPLAFDLDDMLMLDPQAGTPAVAEAGDVALELAPDEWPAATPATELPVLDALQAEAVTPPADEDHAPLAFDLDDMLMLDPPAAQAGTPAVAEASDVALELAPDEWPAATPATELPVLDALQAEAVTPPADEDHAPLAFDLDDMLMADEPVVETTPPAQEEAIMPAAASAEAGVDQALLDMAAPDALPEQAAPALAADALDFAFAPDEPALTDTLAEHDAALAAEAAPLEEDGLFDPLPVLEAVEAAPAAPEAPTLLDLDLALSTPPVLDALHDDDAAPADVAPHAQPVSAAEPVEPQWPLLEEEHPAPAVAEPRPASHDSDILAMLAQSLEGNWWSMVQGSPAHYAMFRRGLGRLAQRLADLPATGLPALVDALIAQADALPISGPSPWAAEAVSQALETLGDALLSLPAPSTTQRAAVQARTRELLAGPPPVAINAPEDAEAEPLAVESDVLSSVAEAPLLDWLEEEGAGPAPVEPLPELPDEQPEILLLDQAQFAAEPAAIDVASPAATAPLPEQGETSASPLVELELELALDGESEAMTIPALSLSDVLEDAPVWPEDDASLAETEAPQASDAAAPLEPEALALADGSVPVEALALEAEPQAALDAASEAAADVDAGWVPEPEAGLPAVLDASDDAAALAELDSVQVIESEPAIVAPAVASPELADDDDWTQPPLAELSRLANEAPLASPAPAEEIEAGPEPVAEVLTHWPADEETAVLPGFAELPELGRAPEPEPEPASPPAAVSPDAETADQAEGNDAGAMNASLETVAEALAADAAGSATDAQAAAVPASERAPLRSITLDDIPHLRQMLGGNSSSGSSFPTVAEALAEPEAGTEDAPVAAPAEATRTPPAFNSIPVNDIPLLRAGTLEALLEKIEPVEETPVETPEPPTPDVVPLGPTQLAAFFASLESSDAPAQQIPAIDLAAFLVVAHGLVQRMAHECRSARSQGIGPGFVSAADALGRSARDAGVLDMANLSSALASALTRPLSPQAVLELATDTVAVLSMMVTQGQRHEPIEGAPDMVAALEALIAKPPVRKLP